MLSETARKSKEIIQQNKTPIRIMEVCGTHTHEIFRLGIRNLLPESVRLISGPGCPVCVTPENYIDEALFLAIEKKCIIGTFGDLVRVPGSGMSLEKARAQGAEIAVLYTPLDAVTLAEKNSDREIVFLSVGFETTTPAHCLSVLHAKKKNLKNFSILTANKIMDNVYETLKDSTDVFLYPGHVSVITGTGIYDNLKEKNISGVVAGFTAEEILNAIATAIIKFKEGRPFSENAYTSVVKREGNPAAKKIIADTMEICTSTWRGLGEIKDSGLELKDSFAEFDARKKFYIPEIPYKKNPACRCGEILQGKISPVKCPCFGTVCTPRNPVGACMVSSEGTCSAFYKYGALTK